MNAQTANLINQLRAGEARTLLQHIDGTAEPYLNASTFAAWKQLKKLATQSMSQSDRLEQLLRDHEAKVAYISFDPVVGFYHDLTLQTLLTEIREEYEAQLSLYDQAIVSVDSEEDGAEDLTAALTELRDECQAELTEVEGIAGGLPAAAPAGYMP